MLRTQPQTHHRFGLTLATLLALLLNLLPNAAPGLPTPTVSAHNLDASVVYAYFDPNTLTMLDARINSPGWTPPTPLLQVGDELGIIIKAVPDNGTTTGVGGYTTFYLPNGVQVLDAAFLLPGSDLSDGITGYDKVSAKGQAQMPSVGAGGGPTVNLVGVTRGPNILGVISPIVAPGNINLGTLPGVYGDTGIFYSTAPETAYGTYTGGTLTNNSGDTVGARTLLGTPLNKWDAWQMQAYGIAGASNPAYSSSPVIDSNGRGYAPWGLANAVAGPQSGYAWEFDKDKYDACDPLPYAPSKSCIDQATQDTGPWQRIKYPGSQFADDPPGANPAVQPYTRGADASSTGFDLTTGDLPPTTGQANGTPNAIRFAFGQLTINTPEFAWVKVKINNTSAILDNTGCPYWRVDTFGGDAGGDSSGKDHIWRYYDPNSVNFNGCLAVGKPATKDVVKVGDTFQYKVKVYNMGNGALSNVVVRDTLPSGVTWISSVPTQNSGPNPLVWNVGAILPGEKFEALVTVKATGSGVLNNTLTATGNPPSGPPITTTAYENTVSGNIPLLNQRKSVTPASVAPGGNVQYTVRIENVGSGPTGSPIAITEYLPAGFTYLSKDSVTVNGANMTAATTVNATNPNQPIFTAPAAVNAGQVLLLIFTAKVGATVTPGSYCNSYKSNQADINLLTGALACVNVGGAAIGDTVYRDWNGNGAQDVGEEALPGIQVCATPTAGGAPICATTDANGNYLINGLTAGSYTVAVTNPPAGYTPRQTVTNPLTLNQGDKIMTADFGYQPGGAGSIGDKVFDDMANDGLFNGADVGIDGVVLTLYEDTNGNGVLDAGQDAQVAATTTAGGGNYSFTSLDPTRSYIVVATDGAGSTVDTHFANPYVSTTSGSSQTISPADFTAQSNAVTDADFGYFGQTPGSIGDTVCVDVDGDKDCDASDQGIAGVDVKLYRDTDGDGEPDPGELVVTVSTDASGHYTFANLGPGAYVVVVDTTDPQIPTGYLPSVSSQTPVTLAVAQNRTDVDFPFGKVLTKAVDKANANPGDTLNYTISANYPSSVLLQNVSITDTIPTGATFTSAGQGGTHSGGVITWNLGSNTDDKPATTAPPGFAVCYASTTLTAVEDTYVDLKNPTNNFGSNTTMLTLPGKSNELKHSLLRFDLSTIPVGAAILNADLKVVVTQNQKDIVDEVHRMQTAWTEAAATWNDSDGAGDWAAGTFGSGDYNAALLGKITPLVKGVQTISVVGAVNDWVNNGVPNRGFVLFSTGKNESSAAYGASENGTATNRPTLTVGYNYLSPTGCNGTTNLTAVADTYVNQEKQTEAKGTATTMLTGPSNNGSSNKQRHSLVKFDLSSIPQGATISSATLDVYVLGNRSSHVDQIHRMLTSWSESASWSDADGSGSGDWSMGNFSSSDYDAASQGTITPDVKNVHRTATITSLVNDWINNGVPNNGLLLRSTGIDTGDAQYATREHGTTSNRPVLTVVWNVPVSTLPQTQVELHAEPLFLGGVGQIKVTMKASSGGTVTGVTPPASLTINATAGASAVLASGPTPAGPVDISPGNPASFVYIYNVTLGSLPGTLNFTGKPAPANNFGTASSEGVIVSPVLTFQVTVNNPASVGVVENVGYISAREPDIKLGPDLCYVVADNAPDASTADRLVSLDPITGDFVDIGATSTNNLEAATWNLGGTMLYGVEAGQLVTIDKNTGARTVVGTVGSINGAFGSIATPDVDGLSFDPADGKLYAVARREDGANGNTLLDVLFQINPVTGARVANAYGSGVDYMTIGTNTLTPALYDVDDIAFDEAGVLYAIANDSTANTGLSDRLITINKATGAASDIAGFIDAATGTTAVTDVEGLSFLPGVGLIASTGDASTTTAQRNTVWLVDAGTAEMYAVVAAPAYSSTDYEAVACLPGPMEPGGLILPSTPSNIAYTALGASIGDLVWADLNGNGLKDANEPGLAGVEVCATPTVGAAVCAVTDSQGVYLIGGLSAATYNVAYTPATAPTGYAPTTPGSFSVSLTTSQQYTLADFGLRPPGTASIGDTVWLDKNEDGVVDPDEVGLANITVRLYIDQNNDGVIDGGDTLLLTDITDESGLYQFTGLHPDDYLVQVVTTGVVTTPFGLATTIGAAMDLTAGATNPRDVTITTVGQAITNADFGYHWGGSIGDYAWYDNNGNQLQDGGEPPAPNATTVLFYDTNGDGNYQSGEPILAVDVTDVSGAYLFDNLPPGNYVVQISEQEVPAPPSSPNAGQIGRMVATTGTSYGLTMAPNQDYLTADFGFMEAAEVEGHVFHDVNHSSVFDPSEPGLSHVTVTLTGIDANGAPVSLTTITDADGEYAFIVPSGSYTITYQTANIPVGLTEATTPTSLSFSVGAGQELSGFDFGVDNAGRIGDTVFIDANSNGVQDASEPGLAGVTVQLYDSTGATLLASTVTTATGGYLFSGLPDGLYQVNPDGTTAPAGYTLTTGNDPDTATVSGGGSDLASDFGYRPPGTLRTISGRVYDDANNNNNDDGEPGFANIDIAILCDTGFFTVRTNATGAWSISGVQNGSICTILDADETDLPRQAYALTEAPTSVTVNADLSGLDFGYHLQPGSISGTVVAGDGDGLAEVGETPIQSVTVTLRYAGVDGILHTVDDVVSTQQTNLGGGYSFTDLNPGLYEIIEINPPNYNSLADADGNHPDSINLMLALDEDRLAQDFEDQAIFTGNPSYALAKWLNGASPVRTGEAVSFTLRITNTGDVTITVLPISDTYDIRYLAFTGATPGPADNSDDGRLDWSDVTSSLGDLAPGAFFDVIVQFTAWHDTTLLPNSTTINRVAAHDVLADPDGAGAIPPQSAPDASPASAGVTIEAPTAVEMAEYTATYLSGQVLLYWRTANEVDAVAFHVLRQTDSGAWVQLTTDPIVAQKAGQVAGAEYTYVDSTVEVRHHYRYTLEVLSTSGKNSYNTIGDVVAILQFFLPLVSGQ